MSKIEELTKEYCKNEHLKGSSFDDISMMKPAYIAGANAVLNEIEKILVAANEQYTTKQAVALNTEIYNKIRELKGE